MKKTTLTAAIVLLATAAAVLTVAVQQYGGINEVLQLPAQLDGNTIADQNGFSLVAITRGHPDDPDYVMPSGAKMFLAAPQSTGDTILWISPPELPPTNLLRIDTTRPIGSLQSFYDIEAISSAGDRFRIPWHYEGGCLEGGGEPCVTTRTASTSPQIIAAVIPSGYPEGISYFDIWISDGFGHRAIWRIDKLPLMHTVATTADNSSFSFHGISFALSAVRAAPDYRSAWPVVKLTMTLQPLPAGTRHKWALFERNDSEPSLAWQPYRMPWTMTTFDRSNQRSLNVYWMFDRTRPVAGAFASISSPYVRQNNIATFHGILAEYETRIDSVHLKNVSIQTIKAPEDGTYQITYCLQLKHKLELISGSGLTFELPAQHSSAKSFLLMSPYCLNMRWHLTPVSPGHNSDTAAYLPDSPLCKQYHEPASVWFDASADGVPLGICPGLPAKPNGSNSAMVRFPTSIGLPPVIHDLKITVHQRVDLQRMPVTLTAPIVQGD